MAGGGFAGAAEFSGGGTERDAARSLDDFADAAVDRCGNASSGIRLGPGVAGGEGSFEGEDDRHRWHDVRGERGDALYRAAGDGGGLSGVSDATGEGLGDRDADAGAVGQAGSQACAEGIERGLGESARSGGAHHEDERWTNAPGLQGGARGGSGDGGGGGGDGGGGRCGRY